MRIRVWSDCTDVLDNSRSFIFRRNVRLSLYLQYSTFLLFQPKRKKINLSTCAPTKTQITLQSVQSDQSSFARRYIPFLAIRNVPS